ncbi:MAG: acryloyl-CoA reductase [Acidimicrobiaceae bacterium]|nr:acryloyl-CoA reductase [Acidimicrobiaceae bacterium]
MRAFLISEDDETLTLEVRDLEAAPEHDQDVLVKVDYSGINFKDAMVAQLGSRVRRLPQLIGGVDAAGTVVHSSNAQVPEGTRVAVHGGNLGVARHGGFAEYVYAPVEFLSVLPQSISNHDAMVIGTAGFTAMASVLALEDHGLAAGAEVLVTGATGGVGSQSVTYLAARGYRPVASTGSLEETPWLIARGADRVIARDAISDKRDRVLGSELWDGAIDCVGGETLSQVLRVLRYGAAVAASGLVASPTLATTVYPFITRSVALLGIDAVEARASTRQRVWATLGETAGSVDFSGLVDRTVGLDDLVEALDSIRNGQTRGRILVDPTPG